MKKIIGYGQYKDDIFNKLGFEFERGKKLLDVGCGDGTDAEIFINEYGLEVYGVDVYEHEYAKNILNDRLIVTGGGIFEIPFEEISFDYIFLHDVLHHIDEKDQSRKKHIAGLENLKNYIKPGGTIIIIEGNRYNPLFYPHMVKKLGHEHFQQKYFEGLVREVFDHAQFKYFEAHNYPKGTVAFWKLYEKFMEVVSPRAFLAYNIAIIKT